MTFNDKLGIAVPDGIGLCIGLDPVIERMPDVVRKSSKPLLDFNRAIIEATSEIAAAYKPNLAFYERHGAAGWKQLEETIEFIPNNCLVIADGKRGDIGSTSVAYAQAIFEGLKADAVTVNPYLGSDAIEPFTQRIDKGCYVLCVTTNKSGAELQELQAGAKQVYQHVISMSKRMNKHGNVGLVMGATKPDLWNKLLEEAVDMPLLIPGVGAQGGDLGELKKAVRPYQGSVLVNASRSIIYASSGDDFTESAYAAALELKQLLTVD